MSSALRQAQYLVHVIKFRSQSTAPNVVSSDNYSHDDDGEEAHLLEAQQRQHASEMEAAFNCFRCIVTAQEGIRLATLRQAQLTVEEALQLQELYRIKLSNSEKLELIEAGLRKSSNAAIGRSKKVAQRMQALATAQTAVMTENAVLHSEVLSLRSATSRASALKEVFAALDARLEGLEASVNGASKESFAKMDAELQRLKLSAGVETALRTENCTLESEAASLRRAEAQSVVLRDAFLSIEDIMRRQKSLIIASGAVVAVFVALYSHRANSRLQSLEQNMTTQGAGMEQLNVKIALEASRQQAYIDSAIKESAKLIAAATAATAAAVQSAPGPAPAIDDNSLLYYSVGAVAVLLSVVIWRH